jgi:hypothetical protein
MRLGEVLGLRWQQEVDPPNKMSRRKDRDAFLSNLNLSRLGGKSLRPMVVHALTSPVWEQFVKREPWRKKAVVIDDAYEYLHHETSVE